MFRYIAFALVCALLFSIAAFGLALADDSAALGASNDAAPSPTPASGPGSAVDWSQNISARLYMDSIGWARVNTGGPLLNLRDMAGARTLILTRIPDGTEVEVLEYGGQWMMIRAGNIAGYAQTEFLLDIDSPSVTPTPAPVESPSPSPAPITLTLDDATPAPSQPESTQAPVAFARVKTEGAPLIVRQKADPSSRIVAMFPNSMMLEVLAKGDSFTLVSKNAISGYAPTYLLEISDKPLARIHSAVVSHMSSPIEASAAIAEQRDSDQSTPLVESTPAPTDSVTTAP